jgi:deoxyribodipyrimidine photo-lyase
LKIALHWFRRDLRLTDNTALSRAIVDNDVVWPVFIFDPTVFTSPDMGAARAQFLLDSLASLQKNLEVKGGRLILRQGDVLTTLQSMVRETGATSIYWNRDYEPYARERDTAVEKAFASQGVVTHACKDGVLLEPHEVLKSDGTPYAVYTPYSRLWRSIIQLKAPVPVTFKPPKTPHPASEPLPSLAQLGFSLQAIIPPGGERAALTRLRKFVGEPIQHYRSQRDLPIIDGTSRLSPDLCLGTLSPRQVYLAAKAAQTKHPAAAAEIDVFINELIWRDFYRAILWHHPQVATRCYQADCDQLAWENNETFFRAWCEGRTGYPLVDAAMRQLNQTGWMHNRLRMIVASFLTKDLLIDYKWGERYFMQKLVDGDLASNNGGWQWSASTGTDAQPYFRIFNPTAQAKKFDPEGKFIEQYVPESNHLSYPPPIVNHAIQREKTLQMFRAVRP